MANVKATRKTRDRELARLQDSDGFAGPKSEDHTRCTNVECGPFDIRFATPQQLRSHLAVFHGGDVRQATNEADSGNTQNVVYWCVECATYYPDILSWLHKDKCQDKKPVRVHSYSSEKVICLICACPATRAILANHLSGDHADELHQLAEFYTNRDSVHTKHTCNCCTHQSDSLVDLLVHISEAHPAAVVMRRLEIEQCNQCGDWVVSGQLKDHQVVLCRKATGRFSTNRATTTTPKDRPMTSGGKAAKRRSSLARSKSGAPPKKSHKKKAVVTTFKEEEHTVADYWDKPGPSGLSGRHQSATDSSLTIKQTATIHRHKHKHTSSKHQKHKPTSASSKAKQHEYACAKCTFSTADLSEFGSHCTEMKCSASQSITCPRCKQTEVQNWQLWMHVIDHEHAKETDLECVLIGQKDDSNPAYAWTSACPHCEAKFFGDALDDGLLLVLHLMFVHLVPVTDAQAIVKEIKGKECSQHNNVAAAGSSSGCAVIGCRVQEQQPITIDNYLPAAKKLTDAPAPPMYSCDVCDVKYHSESTLLVHNNTAHSSPESMMVQNLRKLLKEGELQDLVEEQEARLKRVKKEQMEARQRLEYLGAPNDILQTDLPAQTTDINQDQHPLQEQVNEIDSSSDQLLVGDPHDQLPVETELVSSHSEAEPESGCARLLPFVKDVHKTSNARRQHLPNAYLSKEHITVVNPGRLYPHVQKRQPQSGQPTRGVISPPPQYDHDHQHGLVHGHSYEPIPYAAEAPSGHGQTGRPIGAHAPRLIRAPAFPSMPYRQAQPNLPQTVYMNSASPVLPVGEGRYWSTPKRKHTDMLQTQQMAHRHHTPNTLHLEQHRPVPQLIHRPQRIIMQASSSSKVQPRVSRAMIGQRVVPGRNQKPATMKDVCGRQMIAPNLPPPPTPPQLTYSGNASRKNVSLAAPPPLTSAPVQAQRHYQCTSPTTVLAPQANTVMLSSNAAVYEDIEADYDSSVEDSTDQDEYEEEEEMRRAVNEPALRAGNGLYGRYQAQTRIHTNQLLHPLSSLQPARQSAVTGRVLVANRLSAEQQGQQGVSSLPDGSSAADTNNNHLFPSHG